MCSTLTWCISRGAGIFQLDGYRFSPQGRKPAHQIVTTLVGGAVDVTIRRPVGVAVRWWRSSSHRPAARRAPRSCRDNELPWQTDNYAAAADRYDIAVEGAGPAYLSVIS